MSESIRRMSLAEATASVQELALSYAKAHGVEGALLRVAPDEHETERRGKTPVYWAAVFETAHRGVILDGPSVFCVNLETGLVVPFESP